VPAPFLPIRSANASPSRVRAPIPRRLLLACGPFDGRLDAAGAGRALARGLLADGAPEPDVFALEAGDERAEQAAATLAAEAFDSRLLAARALVLVLARLRREHLAGSLALELATRARQSGVPAYAVLAEDQLDAFDARMLDLQVVLEATDARSLSRAGRRLAELV
jgi:hypothetical protein